MGKLISPPETLRTSRKTLKVGSSTIITNRQPPRRDPDHFKLEKIEITVQEHINAKRRKVKAWKVSPLVRTPLTPMSGIQGGGISKEALRRAKQKHKRRVKSQKKS